MMGAVVVAVEGRKRVVLGFVWSGALGWVTWLGKEGVAVWISLVLAWRGGYIVLELSYRANRRLLDLHLVPGLFVVRGFS